MLELGVIPIINENDAVTVDEIKIGDNDTLSAIVASVAEADLLILLSDIEGLYDKDPHEFADAHLIHDVPHFTRSFSMLPVAPVLPAVPVECILNCLQQKYVYIPV